MISRSDSRLLLVGMTIPDGRCKMGRRWVFDQKNHIRTHLIVDRQLPPQWHVRASLDNPPSCPSVGMHAPTCGRRAAVQVVPRVVGFHHQHGAAAHGLDQPQRKGARGGHGVVTGAWQTGVMQQICGQAGGSNWVLGWCLRVSCCAPGSSNIEEVVARDSFHYSIGCCVCIWCAAVHAGCLNINALAPTPTCGTCITHSQHMHMHVHMHEHTHRATLHAACCTMPATCCALQLHTTHCFLPAPHL